MGNEDNNLLVGVVAVEVGVGVEGGVLMNKLGAAKAPANDDIVLALVLVLPPLGVLLEVGVLVGVVSTGGRYLLGPTPFLIRSSEASFASLRAVTMSISSTIAPLVPLSVQPSPNSFSGAYSDSPIGFLSTTKCISNPCLSPTKVPPTSDFIPIPPLVLPSFVPFCCFIIGMMNCCAVAADTNAPVD